MEIVPDLVFLNCCHLAKMDNTPRRYNRLAYSLSRELIEMGVRCVIAAGWAVDDAAALTFSDTFFRAFTSGDTFGKSVFKARRKTYKMHPGRNTWGAYQAYGDPNYMLHTDKEEDDDDDHWRPVAPQELEDRLKSLSIDLKCSKSSYTENQYNYHELNKRIQKILNCAPQRWICKPHIQYILAELFGTILPDGFEQAEQACQKAITEEDKDGNAPIKALELLGNLESKHSERLSEIAEEKIIASNENDIERKDKSILLNESKLLLKEALYFSEKSINRIQGLIKITHKMHDLSPTNNSNIFSKNTERFALLGGAWKRKAIILIRKNDNWKNITSALENSVKYYKYGEGSSLESDFNPYAAVNRLQISGILNIKNTNHLILAEKAQVTARKTFEKSLDFFDGIMVADVVTAIFLIDDERFKELSDEKDDEEFIVQSYIDSVKGIKYSANEFDSVTKQLKYLSLFLTKRSKSLEDEDANNAIKKAKVLSNVSAALKSHTLRKY